MAVRLVCFTECQEYIAPLFQPPSHTVELDRIPVHDRTDDELML